MRRFRGYMSPIWYLAKHYNFEFIKKLRKKYYAINKFDDKPLSPFEGVDDFDVLLGGLLPIFAMGKDILDTFKPYKSKFYVLRDLLQPIRGLGNLIKGIFNIVVAIPVVLGNIIYALYNRRSDDEYKPSVTSIVLYGCFSLVGHLLDGISNITRGLTQLATTPLTWFIRMPLRGIITGANGMPTLVQELRAKIADENEKPDGCSTQTIQSFIMRKRNKAIKRGQELGTVGGDLATHIIRGNDIKETLKILEMFPEPQRVRDSGSVFEDEVDTLLDEPDRDPFLSI